MSSTPLRFLIAAGPTREFLDPIRYISNRSSGRMGYAVAEAALVVSSHVTLVSGPTSLAAPKGVAFVSVTTAQEMADAVWGRFGAADVCVMAAAVCDFRPKKTAAAKIKKSSFGGTLELEPTPDILAELGRRKQSQVLVGFAAETDDLERHAREKLIRKGLDFIVANDSSAFDSETNRVTILSADGTVEKLPEMPKIEVAKVIIEQALRLVRRHGSSRG